MIIRTFMLTLLTTLSLSLTATSASATTIQVFDGQDLQATIRNATAGQVIVVHQGTYAPVWIGSKSASTPITVVGAVGETAVISNISLYRVDNFAFRNLTITNLFQSRTSSHIEISGSNIGSVQVRDGSTYTTILNNTIANGAAGIWVRTIGNVPPVENVVISGNTIYGQTEDGITLGVANHVLIENNIIRDTVDTSLHNDGIQLSGGYDITIRGNKISNHDEAIILQAEANLTPGNVANQIRIENNLMFNNRGAGVIVAGGVTGADIVNNTFANNAFADVHLEGINSDIRAWNNVMRQIFVRSGSPSFAYEDYNCAQTGGVGSRDITSAPVFIDNINFHQSAASPCRGTGTAVNAPTTDFAGTTRTQPWDMGVWQDSLPASAQTEVFPGDSLESTIRQAQPGATITVHAGSYPSMSLTDFHWQNRLTVIAAPGENVHIGNTSFSNLTNIKLSEISIDGVLTIQSSGNILFEKGRANSVLLQNGTFNSQIVDSTIPGGISIVNTALTAHNNAILIARNIIDAPVFDGVRVASGDGVAIEDNLITKLADNSNFNSGIRISAGANNIIRRNRITGFDQSISLQPESSFGTSNEVRNTRVENNLITASRGAGLFINGPTDTLMTNNTIVDNVYSSLHIQSISPNLSIANNVLDQMYLASGATAPLYENYNCVRSGGKGDRDITSDPLFVNHTDFHLAANSTCRTTGIATYAPADDIAQHSRTQPTDMGIWQDSPPDSTGDVFSSQSLEAAIRRAIPGQVITVHEGTYPALSLSGFSWSTPVLIRGAAGETPIIQGATLVNVTNISFDKLTFSSPVTAKTSVGLTVTHSTLPSVLIKDGSQLITITDNHITGGATGISFTNTSTSPRNQQITMSRNTISNQSIDGINIAAADAVTIEDSNINGTTDTTSFNTGIRINGGDYVVVRRNRVIGFDQSMNLSRSTNIGTTNVVRNVRIENNLVTNSRGAAIALTGGAESINIVNNTAADNLYADYHFQGANTSVRLWNNIGTRIYVPTGSTAPIFEDYNRTSIGATGSHDIAADPLFVDHINYKPAAGSPVLNAGLSADAPPNDINQSPRLQPPDIGAWES